MATEAQIAANGENSLLSTGPSSEEGKEISSKNAITHGLSRSKLDEATRETPEFQARLAELRKMVAPGNWHQEKSLENAAFCSMVAEECRSAYELEVDAVMAEAETPAHWAHARRTEALRLYSRIDRNPLRVVADLRDSLQGQILMVEIWHLLLEGCDQKSGWDDGQIKVANHLMTIPRELRKEHFHKPNLPIDMVCFYQQDLARKNIANLEREIKSFGSQIDENTRETRTRRAGALNDPRVKRCLRYYNEATRRYFKFLKEAGYVTPAVDAGLTKSELKAELRDSLPFEPLGTTEEQVKLATPDPLAEIEQFMEMMQAEEDLTVEEEVAIKEAAVAEMGPPEMTPQFRRLVKRVGEAAALAILENATRALAKPPIEVTNIDLEDIRRTLGTDNYFLAVFRRDAALKLANATPKTEPPAIAS